MARFFGASALVVVTTLAAALAGCTTEAGPVAGPTPMRNATPAVTETAAPALRPNASFDVGCADLLTLAEVQSRVTNPIEIYRDESTLPGSYFRVVDIQQGALSCIWSRGMRFTMLGDAGVELFVKADSVETYGYLSAGETHMPFTVPGADDARRFCVYGELVEGTLAQGRCEIFALVGTTMIQLKYEETEAVFLSEAEVAAVGSELIQLVVDRLRAANRQEQRWVPDPNATVADAAFCADMGAATVAALGVPSSSGGPIGGPFPEGLSGCELWGSSDVFPMAQLFVVQSGAWAIAVNHLEMPGYNTPYSRRTTASGAPWWGSVTDLTIYGRAAVDGSFVEVQIYPELAGVSIAQAEAAMVAVMERYAEVPPGS